MEKPRTACLANAPDPDRLVGGPVCGNGFVERGEQCDCGQPQVQGLVPSTAFCPPPTSGSPVSIPQVGVPCIAVATIRPLLSPEARKEPWRSRGVGGGGEATTASLWACPPWSPVSAQRSAHQDPPLLSPPPGLPEPLLQCHLLPAGRGGRVCPRHVLPRVQGEHRAPRGPLCPRPSHVLTSAVRRGPGHQWQSSRCGCLGACCSH